MSTFLVSLHKAYIISYSIVASAHCCGFILLCKAKNNLPNQRLLTKNLAVTEMLFCINIVFSYFAAVNARNNLTVECLYTFFTALLFTEIRLTVLHLIFDRFLEIFTNIKYPLYMTQKKMLCIMVTHWIASTICATASLIIKLLNTHKGKWHFQALFCLVLDILILISAIATQVYFYITVQKIKVLEARITGRFRETRITVMMRKFKVPCYIVLTYIFCNLSSTVIFASLSYAENKETITIFLNFSQSLIIIGFTSDNVIYVFANANVRRLLRSIFKRRSVQASDSVDVTNL